MTFFNFRNFTIALVFGMTFGLQLNADSVLNREDLTEADLERVKRVTQPTSTFEKIEEFENMTAGATTTKASISKDVFSQFTANLTFEGERDFKLGNGLFRKLWVSSPSSTHASDGLGPLFNARSCQRCHLKDGRGHPPENDGDSATSMIMKLAVFENGKDGLKAFPDPVYGGQLQDFAIQGLKAEGKINIAYEDISVELSDDEVINLRKPTYTISRLGYGPMHADVKMSPRIAPQMIGLGLLESIHPADILENVDENDSDGDGISGRANYFLDANSGERRLGRFGWKATTPSVAQQSANAFLGDIGISSSLQPKAWGDCTEAQEDCRNMPTGVDEDQGPFEASETVMDLVVFYSENLAVPVRRAPSDKEVLKGKEVFYQSGCISCHTPKYVTSRNVDQKEHQFQLIWPYTDMLLHDMGEGLADNFPDGQATGAEWRTAPLWGVGLTEVVNGHTYFLHDGRARSILEAILWHGGEAKNAKDNVIALSPDDRNALLKFINSL